MLKIKKKGKLHDFLIKKEGILYTESSIKEELDKINKLQCWIPNCPDTQVFNTIAFLKKHLKEKHQRFLWLAYFSEKIKK